MRIPKPDWSLIYWSLLFRVKRNAQAPYGCRGILGVLMMIHHSVKPEDIFNCLDRLERINPSQIPQYYGDVLPVTILIADKRVIALYGSRI